MAVKIHFSNVRPNAFGGITTGTLCNRFRSDLDDGMNLSTSREEVTCFFCLKRLAVKDKIAARAA